MKTECQMLKLLNRKKIEDDKLKSTDLLSLKRRWNDKGPNA